MIICLNIIIELIKEQSQIKKKWWSKINIKSKICHPTRKGKSKFLIYRSFIERQKISLSPKKRFHPKAKTPHGKILIHKEFRTFSID